MNDRKALPEPVTSATLPFKLALSRPSGPGITAYGLVEAAALPFSVPFEATIFEIILIVLINLENSLLEVVL